MKNIIIITLTPRLETQLPAVVVVGNDLRVAPGIGVIRDVGLHLQTVSDDVARDAEGRLVAVAVPGQRMDLAVRKERRVAQGNLPFAVKEVAGLDVEPLSGVDACRGIFVEERTVARTPAHCLITS